MTESYICMPVSVIRLAGVSGEFVVPVDSHLLVQASLQGTFHICKENIYLELDPFAMHEGVVCPPVHVDD